MTLVLVLSHLQLALHPLGGQDGSLELSLSIYPIKYSTASGCGCIIEQCQAGHGSMPQEEERREPRAASPFLEVSREEVLALSSLLPEYWHSFTLTRDQAMTFWSTVPAEPLRKKIINPYIWSELCGPVLAASKQDQICKKLVD